MNKYATIIVFNNIISQIFNLFLFGEEMKIDHY